MARNEEKAQAMLNRWVTMKRRLASGPLEERPALASDTDSIQECEKWRQDLIREVVKKISEIQNAGLGEHRIRDLNDEINKLIREKEMWEDRIKQLGGADFRALGQKLYETAGIELPGSGGYKYFGAAKDLPGVRELFQREKPTAPKKGKGEQYKNLDYDYFGFKEENDPELLERERECEEQQQSEAVEEWVLQNKDILVKHFNKEEVPTNEELQVFLSRDYENARKEHELTLKAKSKELSQEDDYRRVLEERKKALLSQFFSEQIRDVDIKQLILNQD